MRNISTSEKMRLTKRIITPEIGKNTPLGMSLPEWDLTKIAALVTADTLESSRARQAAIRRASQSSVTGAFLGGAVGGALDAASGDDGILDGVLLGAAFGTIMSGSSVGPVEPKARIGVIFTDGETLSLEVDADEYTILQTAAEKALRSPERDRSGASIRRVPMTLDGAECIVSERAKSAALNFGLIVGSMGAGLLLTSLTLHAFGGYTETPVQDAFPFGEEMGTYFLNFGPYIGIGFVALGAIRAAFPLGRRSVLDRTEEAAYQALRQQRPSAVRAAT